jgi:hypothetical protein
MVVFRCWRRRGRRCVLLLLAHPATLQSKLLRPQRKLGTHTTDFVVLRGAAQEDYAEKMPFRFTGTLNKFAVVLDPHSLSPEEQKLLHDQLAKAMMAVQ